MKRILIIAFALVVAAAGLQAQNGDARAAGLAGAMTAVNDDMNTLFYNPAGLAFLRRGYLNLEANGDLSLTKGTFAPSATPFVYTYWDGSSNVYKYWDEFLMRDVEFDFEKYKIELSDFAASAGMTEAWGSLSQDQKYQIYQKYQQSRSTYEGLSGISPLNIKPRAIIGGKNWGVAATSEFELIPVFPVGFAGIDTPMSYQVRRRLGAVAGFGLRFGPFAVGANAKYLQTSAYDQKVDFRQLSKDGPSPDFFSGLFAVESEVSDTSVEIGLGGVFTLGSLNASVYADNILPFIDNPDVDFGQAFLNGMSFGLSWMPSDNKFARGKIPLVLLGALDLKNFGDEDNRQLSAGMEIGLNAGDFLVGLWRMGYTQPLPGGLGQAFSGIDTDIGLVTLGATARFWLLKIDAAFTLPMYQLKELALMGGTIPDAERMKRFATLNLGVSLAF